MSGIVPFVPKTWPKMSNEEAIAHAAKIEASATCDSFVIYDDYDKAVVEIPVIIARLQELGHQCSLGPGIYRLLTGSQTLFTHPRPEETAIYIDITPRFPGDDMAALRYMYSLQNQLYAELKFKALYNEIDYVALTEMFLENSNKKGEDPDGKE